MKPPKTKGVLIIVENLPVPFDRRVWQEATALKEAGYCVSVICPVGKGHDLAEESLEGINIYRHSVAFEADSSLGYLVEYSVALFWEFFLACKVLRRHGFDVIHACNPPDLIYLVAAFFKTVFRKKFIFDQHDLNPELYEVKFGKRGFFHTLLCHFERRTFRWADASIATNQTFKEIAITRGKMQTDKVWIVKSFPALSRFKRVEPIPELRKNYKYLLGYVGIIAPQDGVDLLVRAMSCIVQSGRTDCGCVVIGSGPALEGLKSLAKQLNVDSYINFAGYLTGNNLLAHLSTLDIGVIPDPSNPCNDKLSMNKVFEYMALGLPFVQFDLPQSRSEAGEAAFVAKSCTPESLAESILALLADEAARHRMARFGVERAQSEFQWDKEKLSLLAAYENVIGRP
jgi:glycosyltransferase involved in cell wall biosynthesis